MRKSGFNHEKQRWIEPPSKKFELQNMKHNSKNPVHRTTIYHMSVDQDLKMFGAALSACDRGKQWPLALAVLEQMEVEKVAPGQIACNSVVPWRWRCEPHGAH